MIEILQQEERYLVAKANVTEASLSNADVFKQKLIGWLDQHNKTIIVDLQQVAYADSSFLGALVAALKHAISKKKDIVLVGLQKDIHNLMSLIRLDKVFKIYSSLPEAVKTL